MKKALFPGLEPGINFMKNGSNSVNNMLAFS